MTVCIECIGMIPSKGIVWIRSPSFDAFIVLLTVANAVAVVTESAGGTGRAAEGVKFR